MQVQVWRQILSEGGVDTALLWSSAGRRMIRVKARAMGWMGWSGRELYVCM